MTYKNGIKEYVLITVMFGLPMGALLGFVNSSITAGLISGIFSGLLFSFLMFLFNDLYGFFNWQTIQKCQAAAA